MEAQGVQERKWRKARHESQILAQEFRTIFCARWARSLRAGDHEELEGVCLASIGQSHAGWLHSRPANVDGRPGWVNPDQASCCSVRKTRNVGDGAVEGTRVAWEVQTIVRKHVVWVSTRRIFERKSVLTFCKAI